MDEANIPGDLLLHRTFGRARVFVHTTDNSSWRQVGPFRFEVYVGNDWVRVAFASHDSKYAALSELEMAVEALAGGEVAEVNSHVLFSAISQIAQRHSGQIIESGSDAQVETETASSGDLDDDRLG